MQEKQARKVAKALGRSGVTVKQTGMDEVQLVSGKSQGFIPSHPGIFDKLNLPVTITISFFLGAGLGCLF